MQAIVDLGQWLHETHGIKLTILYDEWDRARFLKGIWTTFHLSIVCIIASVAIGLVGAWLQMSHYRIVRAVVDAYIQFFRNTPPLIQLYLFYFGLDSLLIDASDGAVGNMSSYFWAAFSLSFFAGAFNVEIFRAGIEAVPTGLSEAARSLGLRSLQIFTLITVPLAFRIVLPSLSSNLINLIKTTTVAYAIAVPETLYVANQIWSDENNVPEMMNIVWVFYLSVVSLLVWMMTTWERSLRLPGVGQQSK